MKLRALTNVQHQGEDYRRGDIFTALPEEAADLIRLGYAEDAEIEEPDE